MPIDRTPLVALEIGTTKVRALVAEARDDNHLNIIGFGEKPSRGVRKSEIIDVESAGSCAREALQEAAETSSTEIRQVHLMASGGHIQSMVNRGSVPILNATSEITGDDVDHVMEAARKVSLAAEREVLHTICQHFYVDDQKGVLRPEGLEGRYLALDMLILHGVRTRLRNTIRAARTVPVDIQDVAFSGLCAALAVLTPEQKETGAIVIDLGGGTTSYVVYAGSAIAAAGCIGVGGDHITNDVSQGLCIPRLQAEALKERQGSAMVEVQTRNQRIEIASEGGYGRRFIKIGDLQMITNLRMEETFYLVRQNLERLDLMHQLGAGVVLTGGGAYLRRVTELASRVFGLPCTVGVPREISGLSLSSGSAQYASLVGMLRYAARTAAQEESGTWLGKLIENVFRFRT